MSDETKWTPGDWKAFNMVHAETGERMTPDEVGEYVAKCMRLRPECDDFLFISVDTPEGSRDVCHVGNGPDGPYNAALIEAAPTMADALMCWPLNELMGMIEDSGDAAMRERAKWFMEVRDHALAKARGETS